MSNTVKIILSTVAWCGLLAYVIFACNLCSREKDIIPVSEVEIKVLDQSKLSLITSETIKEWLNEGGFDLTNSDIGEINTDEINSYIAGRPFVKRVRVYTDMNGTIHIELTQRRPIARINTTNGYNFYISDDEWILPVQKGSSVYVPIITGTIPFPFERDFSGSIESIALDPQKKISQSYLYLRKLINFVKLIGSSSFWEAQIVQINVPGKSVPAFEENGDNNFKWAEPDVELIPRVGKHIVVLGGLDGAGDKLEKLMLFYRKVLDYEGWDQYRVINLKYKDQIVCRR